MKELVLAFAFLCFLCCHYSDQKLAQKDDDIDTNNHCLNLLQWNQEFLDVDSITITGNIPLSTSIKNLYTILGKPDAVTQDYINFTNNEKKSLKSKILYYKNVQYITFNENAYIRSINFESSSLKVIYPKITLDGNTTIMDVQKTFPQSGKLARGMGSTFTGYMQLRTSKNWSDISLWFLIFKNTKLVRMDFIDPRYLN